VPKPTPGGYYGGMGTSPVAPLEPEIAPVPAAPKKIDVKLIWAGGAVVLLIAVLVTCGTFTSANSNAAKPAGVVSEANKDASKNASKAATPAVAAAPETNPAPAQPSIPAAASWIPVYPDSKPDITSSAQTPENDQKIWTFKTPDAPPKVVSYFQNQLMSSGFNIKAASSGEDNGSLLAEDGARKRSLVFNVNLNTAPGGTGSEARLVTMEKKVAEPRPN
jgi:hypothetical protein